MDDAVVDTKMKIYFQQQKRERMNGSFITLNAVVNLKVGTIDISLATATTGGLCAA